MTVVKKSLSSLYLKERSSDIMNKHKKIFIIFAIAMIINVILVVKIRIWQYEKISEYLLLTHGIRYSILLEILIGVLIGIIWYKIFGKHKK